MFWLLVGRLLSPFWLSLDFLIDRSVFLCVYVETLVILNLYGRSTEIVGIKDNITVVISILHELYRLLLALCLYANDLVQGLCH